MSDGQMLMDSIWELVGDPYGGQAEEWYEAASKVQSDLRRKHRQELLDELIARAKKAPIDLSIDDGTGWSRIWFHPDVVVWLNIIKEDQ